MDYGDWKIKPKINDPDLKKPNNDADNYRVWRNWIKYHICSGNQARGRLLEVMEKHRTPLTFAFLQQTTTVDGAPLDLPHLSRDLWSFLGPRLGDDVYSRRTQIAGGEDRNGFELWRRLFMENEGGAEQVALAGLRRFHSFSQVPL